MVSRIPWRRLPQQGFGLAIVFQGARNICMGRDPRSRVPAAQRYVNASFLVGFVDTRVELERFFQISDPRRPVDARLHPAETKIEFGALFFAPDAAFQKLDSSCPMPGGFFIREDN